jgi:rhodanese-related sulfurtransferase
VPLRLPAAADVDPSGIVDLGADGSAVVCAASAVNFALRTPEEQEALVGAFGRFLNALDGPVLILVSTARANLRGTIERLDVGAADLPHPALEAAARSHAAFLTQLAARRELLAHRCFVVFRDPAVPDVAVDTLGRRVQEAATSLAAAGVELTPLNAVDADAALAGCADPDRSRPAGRRGDPHLLIGAHRAAS